MTATGDLDPGLRTIGAGPLADAAGHVLDAIRAGVHRSRAGLAQPPGQLKLAWPLTAPGKAATVDTLGRLLPLGQARQLLTGPAGIGLRIRTRDVGQRERATAARPTTVLPVGRRRVSGGRKKPGVGGVGQLQLVNEECGQVGARGDQSHPGWVLQRHPHDEVPHESPRVAGDREREADRAGNDDLIDAELERHGSVAEWTQFLAGRGELNHQPGRYGLDRDPTDPLGLTPEPTDRGQRAMALGQCRQRLDGVRIAPRLELCRSACARLTQRGQPGGQRRLDRQAAQRNASLLPATQIDQRTGLFEPVAGRDPAGKRLGCRTCARGALEQRARGGDLAAGQSRPGLGKDRQGDSAFDSLETGSGFRRSGTQAERASKLIGGGLVIALGQPGFGATQHLPILACAQLAQPHERREQHDQADHQRETDHPVTLDPANRNAQQGRRAGQNCLSPQKALQVLGQQRGRVVAMARLLLDRLDADDLQIGRQSGPQTRGPLRLGLEDLAVDLHRGAAMERQPTGQHLIEHDAQRIDVAASVDLIQLSTHLLRGHVERRAHRAAGLGQMGLRIELARQTEVDHDRGVVRIADQDVSGLQVPVNDSLQVGGVHRLGDTAQHLHQRIARVAAQRQDRLERLPDNAVHRDVMQALLDAHLMHRDDVGMLQPGGRARLPLKPGSQRALVARLLEDLQRHGATERHVFRLVDHRHPAATQLLQNAILAQLLRPLRQREAQRLQSLGIGAAPRGQVLHPAAAVVRAGDDEDLPAALAVQVDPFLIAQHVVGRAATGALEQVFSLILENLE